MKNKSKIKVLVIGIIILSGLLSFLIVNKELQSRKTKNVVVKNVEVEKAKGKKKKEPNKKDKKETTKKEEKKDETIESYNVIKYNIKYKLESEENKEVDAILRVKLSEEESTYASFIKKETKKVRSEIRNKGKELILYIKNVKTNEETNEEIEIQITGAPNGYKVSPKVEVEINKNEKKEVSSPAYEVKTTSIEGKIIDTNKRAKSNEEVILYKIENKIEKRIKSTYTDSEGRYVFSDIEEGEYKVESKNGYEAIVEVKEGSNVVDVKANEKGKFNVKIRKTIEKVVITENNKTKIYTYEEAKKAAAAIKRKAKVEIDYKIEIENEGEKEGYVKVIKETLPEGFKIKEKGAWEEKNGVLYNKSISNEKIRSKEKKELKVEIESKEEVEAKEYINKVSLTKEEYHTVTYVVDSEEVKIISVLDSDKIDEIEYKKEGKEVEKWYKDKELTEEFDFTTPIEKDTVVYGKTSHVEEAEVKYNDLGEIIKTEIVRINESLNPPEEVKEDNHYPGHTFKYWSLEEDGEEYNIENGVTEDTTLYAVYEINKYTIEFYDGSTKLSVKDNYNFNELIDEPDTNKEHYIFQNWQTIDGNIINVTGKLAYQIFDENDIDDNKIKLYANYDREKYNVKFIDDGNVVKEEEVYYKDLISEVPEVSMEGYSFTGWKERNVEENFNFTTPIEKDTTLYSNYEKLKNSVIFDDENRITIKEVEYGNLVEEIASKGKEGHTFRCWSKTRTCDDPFDFNTPITETTPLYAVYEVNTHTISIDPAGGTYNDNPGITTIDVEYGEVVPIDNPVKTGYTFDNWTSDPDVLDNNEITVPDSDVTLVANYTANTYTVIFHSNKEEDTTKEQTFTYDKPQALDENTFDNYGYNFTGWSTTPDGSTVYTDKQVVNNLTSENNGQVHLYAVWEKRLFTVTYVDNNQEYYSEEVLYMEKALGPKDIGGNPISPTKDGYAFDGWYLDSAKYDFNSEVVRDLTLVSKYNIDKVPTITHSPQDWTSGNVTVTISTDTNLTTEYKIIKNGVSSVYTEYSEPFILEENSLVVARYKNSEKIGNEVEHYVKNIDKVNPILNSSSITSEETTYSSIKVSVRTHDEASRVKNINIYLDENNDGIEDTEELKCTKNYLVPGSFDNPGEEEFNYNECTLSNLLEDTEYNIIVKITDFAGNTVKESNILKTDINMDNFVADIIYLEGNDSVNEENSILFRTLQSAIDYCENNTCTIRMLKSVDLTSSATVLNNQNIKLDINGKTINSDVSSVPTMTNNGSLQIVDNSLTEGSIVSSVYDGIYNDGTLIIGDNEATDDDSDGSIVSQTSPNIIGARHGITSDNIFKFYDGKIEGGSSAINGEVSSKPYLYDVLISTSDTQVATLKILQESEARIKRTNAYYSKLSGALEETYKGYYSEDEGKQVDFINNFSNITDNGFEIQKIDGQLVLANSNMIVTQSKPQQGVIEIDLTNSDKDYTLSLDVLLASGGARKFITVNNTPEYTPYTWSTALYACVQGESCENDVVETALQKGQKYYVHFGIENANAGSSSTTNNHFYIKNIKVQNSKTTSTTSGDEYFGDIITNSESGFYYDSKGYITNDNDNAESYITLDLTGETGDKLLTITGSRDYSEYDVNNYSFIHVDESPLDVTVDNAEQVDRMDSISYSKVIPAGKVYYIHLGASTAENTKINSINLKEYTRNYELITNGANGFIYDTNNKIISEKANSQSYIELDLTDKEYDQLLEVNANKVWTSYNAWITIDENTSDTIYDETSEDQITIKSNNGYSSSYKKILEKGKIYYLHIGAEKEEDLTINSLKLSDYNEVDLDNEVITNGDSGFNTITSSSQTECTNNNDNAKSYIEFDLTSATSAKTLVVNISAGSDGFKWLYTSANSNDPASYSLDAETGPGTFYFGAPGAGPSNTDFSKTLTPGSITYLHIIGSVAHNLIINSITLDGVPVSFNEIRTNGDSGFNYSSDTTSVFSNENANAQSYFTFDLTNVDNNENLYIDADIVDPNGKYYFEVNDSPNDLTNFTPLSFPYGNLSYGLTLEKNKVNYLHIYAQNEKSLNINKIYTENNSHNINEEGDYSLITSASYIDGTTTIYPYETPAPIINEEEDTVEILKNIDVTEDIIIDEIEKVTLDLRGYNLRLSKNIINNGNLTIIDSKYQNNGSRLGTITGKDVINKLDSVLTVEDGIIDKIDNSGELILGANSSIGDVTNNKLSTINGNGGVVTGLLVDNSIQNSFSNLNVNEFDVKSSQTKEFSNMNITKLSGTNLIINDNSIVETVDGHNVTMNGGYIETVYAFEFLATNGTVGTIVGIYSAGARAGDFTNIVNLTGDVIVNNTIEADIVTLGKKDSVIHEYPKILYKEPEFSSNDIYSIYAKKINFYDGIVRGKSNKEFLYINDIENGSEILYRNIDTSEEEEEEEEQEAYLVYCDPVARIGNTTYTNLNDAFNSITTSDETTIELLRSINHIGTITIPSDRNIIFNTNGYSIDVRKCIDSFIINNGNLKIIDNTAIKYDETVIPGATVITDYDLDTSNYNKGQIIRKGIVNNGTIILDGPKISTIDNNSNLSIEYAQFNRIISNSGNIVINNGKTFRIDADRIDSYSNIYNYGTSTLTINNLKMDGYINNNSEGSISNNENVVINNIDISSSSSFIDESIPFERLASFNNIKGKIHFYNGNVNVDNSSANSINNSPYGTIIIDGGNFSSIRGNNGRITMIDGDFSGTIYNNEMFYLQGGTTGAIENNRELIVGNKDGIVDITNPVIMGGIRNNDTTYFYDGMVVVPNNGNHTSGIEGVVNEIEDDYMIYNDSTKIDDKIVTYLTKKYLVEVDNDKYYTLKEAVESEHCISSCNIKYLSSITMIDDELIRIENNQDITISVLKDIKSDVDTKILNNGKLTFEGSEDFDYTIYNYNELVNNSAHILNVINYDKLTINNGYFDSVTSLSGNVIIDGTNSCPNEINGLYGRIGNMVINNTGTSKLVINNTYCKSYNNIGGYERYEYISYDLNNDSSEKVVINNGRAGFIKNYIDEMNNNTGDRNIKVSGGIYNIVYNNVGNIDISNSILYSIKNYSNMSIEDSTIEYSETNNYENATLVVKSGIIKSYINNYGTLTYGENDEHINKNLVIHSFEPDSEISPHYCINNRGIFNFYDGKIEVIGRERYLTDNFVLGSISSISENSSLISDVDNDNYKKEVYTSSQKVFSIDNHEFYTFSDAINSEYCNNSCEIKYLHNIFDINNYTIPSNKYIELDLNGKDVTYSNDNGFYFTNNATFSIKDSTVNDDNKGGSLNLVIPSEETSYNSLILKNNNILEINNIKINRNMINTISNYIIDNTKDLTINNTDISNGGIKTTDGTTTLNNVNIINGSELDAVTSLQTINNGHLVINDGTVTGGISIDANSNLTNEDAVLINGGTINNRIIINSSNDVEITNATINHLVENSGNLTIGINAVLNKEINNYNNLYVNDGTISSIVNSKNMVMNGGTVDSIRNEYYGVINGGTVENGIVNYSRLIITNGSINGSTAITNSGTLTLGVNGKENETDSRIVNEYPLIMGSEYGVHNTGTFNFYDGIVKGYLDKSIDGIIDDIESGYQLKRTTIGTTEEAKLVIIGEDTRTVGLPDLNLNFVDLQAAINSVPDNTPTRMLLYANIILDKDIVIPENKIINFYYNGYTIDKDGHTITNNGEFNIMDADENSGSLLDAVLHLLNLDKTSNVRKNVVVYETENGEKLSAAFDYKLYVKNNDDYISVDVDEVFEDVGRYNIATSRSDTLLRTVNGNIYISGLHEGEYMLKNVNNNKKSIFSVTSDSKVVGNAKESYITSINELESKASSSAKLILNIQTGIKVIRYGLIIGLLGFITTVLLITRKKLKD